jgi:hypothetical protein
LAVPDAANAIAEEILLIGRNHTRSVRATAEGIAAMAAADL